MLTITTPGIVTKTDLHQVRTVSQREVTRIVKQSIIIQSQHLQTLKMIKCFELDVVDQITVKIQFPQTCK